MIEERPNSAALVVGHVIGKSGPDVVVNINHLKSSLAVRLRLDEASHLAERLQELVDQLRSEHG